jgi:enterochelin esterase-like enzyme
MIAPERVPADSGGSMRLATLLCLCLAFSSSAYADDNVSGRYSGVLSGKKAHGSGPEAKLFLIVVQSGERISCFASLTSFDQDQVACQDVSKIGTEIKFSLPWGAGVILDVTLKDEELNGTIRPAPSVPPGPFNPGPFSVVVSKRVAALTLSDQLPLLTWEAAGPRSPTMSQLRKDVLDGRRAALDAFWTTVEKSGAPIVERLQGTDQTFLVTFLWKGNSETINVLVGWPRMANTYPDGYFMSHVGGTDLWFKTLKVRRGTRIYYQLSPNDPAGVRPDGTWPRRSQADPLNPQRDPDDPKVPLERVRSLLELPGALPQPWYKKRHDVPHYSVKEESVSSRHLNSERKVLIYTPPGYSERNPPYPTVYLTDGEDPDGLVFATSTLENLVADGRIPPVVVVRMVNPDRPTRGRDLACNDAFLAYVNYELVPFVRRMYNTSRDPLSTLIGGDSLGGLTATCMGLRHPETFGMVLSQSGAYWYKQSRDEYAEPNWLAQQFVESKKLPLRFYLDAGTNEVDLSGKGEDILLTNRHLRDVLRAKGYEVHYQEFEGDHDWINWRGTLADGLIAMLGK